MMKIIVVGGTGTIGQAVSEALSERHEVVAVGLNSGQLRVNVEDTQSIKSMYQKIGSFDALVATTGRVVFKNTVEMTAEEYSVGLNSKLMGSVNLVLEGLAHIGEGGSFTLTTGIINRDPIALGSSAAMVNGALEAFVKASAIELPRGIRINAVSPTVIEEALPAYGPYFRGFKAISAKDAANYYMKSVEGLQTGQIYHAD